MLAVASVEREHFCGLRERFCAGVSTTGESRFEIAGARAPRRRARPLSARERVPARDAGLRRRHLYRQHAEVWDVPTHGALSEFQARGLSNRLINQRAPFRARNAQSVALD